MRRANSCSRIRPASKVFAARWHAGVDILVHTTLGEKVAWDAALLAEMVAKHMSVIPTFKLWPYELRKEGVPPAVIDRLVSATLEELRAFKAAGGQILFGTDVGYMHEYDPTDEYVLHGAGRHDAHADPGVAHHRTGRALERQTIVVVASRPAWTRTSSCSRPIPPTT